MSYIYIYIYVHIYIYIYIYIGPRAGRDGRELPVPLGRRGALEAAAAAAEGRRPEPAAGAPPGDLAPPAAAPGRPRPARGGRARAERRRGGAGRALRRALARDAPAPCGAPGGGGRLVALALGQGALPAGAGLPLSEGL